MNYKHGCAAVAGRKSSNLQWKAHYTWLGMKARCDNPKNKQYPDWGGRGITYDPAWADFNQFLIDMGSPPTTEMTLDRIDNNGNYCKSNCRWATRTQQSQNRRNNRYLELNGERLLAPEWAKRLGVNPRLIRVRLNRGWSVERTLMTPVQTGV